MSETLARIILREKMKLLFDSGLGRRDRLRFNSLALMIAGVLTLGSLADSLHSPAFIHQSCRVISRQARSFSRATPTRKIIIPQITMVTATSPVCDDQHDQVLPKDDTWSIRGAWRELTSTGLQPSEKTAQRFDELGSKTGGIWRTRFLGFLPRTIFAAPITTPWLSKMEAAGKIDAEWPASTERLLGERSILSSDLSQAEHEQVRDLYAQVLGPKAILSVELLVVDTLEKHMSIWRGYAETGEEVRFCNALSDFTLEVIATCFLGNIRKDALQVIFKNIRVLGTALFSLPFRLPWPLSATPLAWFPALSFGRGMEARERMIEVICSVLDEKREALSGGGSVGDTYSVVDNMLEMQAAQREKGGPSEGELLLDDALICDNVITALLAGFDTTSGVLTRFLELLASPGEEWLIDEMLSEITSRELKPGPEMSGGLLAGYPLLFSTLMEQFRIYPIALGVFRTSKEDLNYNGYDIPKGTQFFWSIIPSLRSRRLYPEPERFCPFRFLHSKDREGLPLPVTDVDHLTGRAVDEPEQPRPTMFGFGRHRCPGRELAKLEIVSFLKRFLAEFDFRLIEGQDLRGKIPGNKPKSGLRIVLSKKT